MYTQTNGLSRMQQHPSLKLSVPVGVGCRSSSSLIGCTVVCHGPPELGSVTGRLMSPVGGQVASFHASITGFPVFQAALKSTDLFDYSLRLRRVVTGAFRRRSTVSLFIVKKFAADNKKVGRFPSGLPLSFLNWAYVRQGVYFWAYGTPGVTIFGVFRTPSLPIFGVIFGLLEATKIYKLF